MAGEIEAAVQAGLAILRSIDGLRNAPDYPPDNPHAYPVLVGAASEGVWITESYGQLHALHTLRIGFYTTRQNLPKDMVTIMPFGEKAKDKLLSPTVGDWDGTISGYGNEPLSYTFGDIEYYPGLFLIGWTLSHQIKIRYIWNTTTEQYQRG